MILKRKMYDKLLTLKNELNGKKAFLIEGARRIGKSTICEEFGRNEYKSYILIDFAKCPDEVKDYFVHHIEVKSGKKYSIESLKRFKEKYKARIGECYVIHPRNLSFKEDIVCIPPYMTICL